MLNKELIVFVKDISEENKLFIEDHKLSINMVNLYSKKDFFDVLYKVNEAYMYKNMLLLINYQDLDLVAEFLHKYKKRIEDKVLISHDETEYIDDIFCFLGSICSFKHYNNISFQNFTFFIYAKRVKYTLDKTLFVLMDRLNSENCDPIKNSDNLLYIKEVYDAIINMLVNETYVNLARSKESDIEFYIKNKIYSGIKNLELEIDIAKTIAYNKKMNNEDYYQDDIFAAVLNKHHL